MLDYVIQNASGFVNSETYKDNGSSCYYRHSLIYEPKFPDFSDLIPKRIREHLPTFQLLGIQFGVSESTANDTFNYWLPLLRELLPSSLIEQVKKKESDYELVKEILTEYELIVDSYEQVREISGGNKEQEKYYSGKASKHTFKSQIIILPNQGKRKKNDMLIC